MYRLSGGCYCGNIHLEVALAREPSSYHPRACDCDFCQKHGAAYISDPQGSLVIRIKGERETNRYRQGSGIAEMLVCRTCGVMVGALYRDQGSLFGTVNFRVLDSRADFGAEQTVSPRKLAPDEKTKRWQDLWIADVTIINADL
jgi:hypothetical protein